MPKWLKITLLSFAVIIFLLIFAYLFGVEWYRERRNKQQLAEIKTENIVNYQVFKDFIEEIERETDWEVLIVSGYRTEDEQEILKKINPKNASAGKSKHNFAKAIDICLYKRKFIFSRWLLKSSSKKRWEESGVVKIAGKYNLTWGGNFKNYHDPVHFEVE
jgi:D-alanyl-D-alanine carboxypeptidase